MNLIFDGRNALGECAVWCERTRRVFWTDILQSVLWSYEPATGQSQSWTMPDRLCCFALTEDSDCLLLGLASRLAYFRLGSGEIAAICEVEQDVPTTRLNDGRCDRQGRFVFGTLNEDPGRAPIGHFYRLDAHLRLEKLLLPGVAIPNSINFSPDGRRMYYCDSLTQTLRCCDYDGPGPEFANDRLFADLRSEPGVPDGSTVDSAGYLWNAHWGAARVVRYAPDGRIDRIVPVPVEQPSCVAFGGDELDCLYVTSASVELSAAALSAAPHSGGLFAARMPDVTGLPESRFAGIVPGSGTAAFRRDAA
jgi:L-arabinonolactonase